MKYIELTAEEIRNIITGKTTYRKCPLCDNEGVELIPYNDDGNFVSPDYEGEKYYDDCANCDGVAFIKSAQ